VVQEVCKVVKVVCKAHQDKEVCKGHQVKEVCKAHQDKEACKDHQEVCKDHHKVVKECSKEEVVTEMMMMIANMVENIKSIVNAQLTFAVVPS